MPRRDSTPVRLAKSTLPALAALLFACAQPAPPPPAPQPAVESQALGLRVASVPPPFSLAADDGESLRFAVPEADGGGELVVTAGSEETSGINLVDGLKEREAAFLALADGEFFGQLEIAGPYGPAFTARGAYSEDNGPVEESWIYSLHPGANRLLTVVYRYRRGDAANSKTRVNQLLEFFGEIEPLG